MYEVLLMLRIFGNLISSDLDRGCDIIGLVFSRLDFLNIAIIFF